MSEILLTIPLDPVPPYQLHPAKQMASRIVGSDPRTDLPPAATASDRRPQQLHRKITSVIGGGPT